MHKYCDLNKLISISNVEKILNLSEIKLPDNLTQTDFDALYNILDNASKEKVAALYDFDTDLYILKELDESRQKFLLSILMIVKPDNAIKSHLDSATAKINGLIIKRYPVPLNPVPDEVPELCGQIALGTLLTKKGVRDDPGDKAIIDQAANAVKHFENVAKGILDLAVAKEDNMQSSPETGNIQVMSRDKLDWGGY